MDALKQAPIERLSVGPLQPRDPAAPVNRLSLRGANLVAGQGSFAQYLEAALIQDLREISVYDPAAQTRIDGTILQNEINVADFSTGTGLMEVELRVTRAGQTRLKKVYRTETRFESSFAGAVAIPKGQSEYGYLVRTLLGTVYADPEFINAIKK
ncbi:hypothetical protein OOT46_24215 [Aquabacterium sp. A7-Y]|uniref:hypothetical protein n=1 Tax=Aquabacterium sp. A7-Y TaxID=1349605 RepID=UPI00223DDAD2|nr:hypothetical protein [Aquabacterium sp. A7-Y]MCW7540930.1 hypothetical protein [Aquabacterium sp. A7-Y]